MKCDLLTHTENLQIKANTMHVSVSFSTPLILFSTEAYENITQHIRHDLLSRDADMDGNLQVEGWTCSHMATPSASQRRQALAAFESLLGSHSNEETSALLGAIIRFYSGKLICFICSHWQKCQKLLSEDISLWWLYTCDLLKIRPA